ncbi:dihydrolipoamide acetyltransferase family protein [Acaryochloris marina]|uniref:dihydrolipoamide acetyltransferase family protein n=1 Tax=Acaryochloris marina TaxID=155978 RepID=UPI001BAFF69B|nr:dihydrolipoamide acetyltransferase family protein [Acaryochloris marina]QUY42986.1 2-oxo acid dehydrogenase subunit E2 [Acaryochloris marina S15]
MIHEVFMPALSSTMEEGKIVSWSKEPGDKVEKGETVLVVESDKADMDVESFYGGYLAAIAVPAGGVAKVGAAIGYVAETEAEISEAQKKAAAAESAAPAPAVAPAPAPAPAAPVAAPAPAPIATAPVAPAATLNGGSAPAAPANGRVVVSPRARKLAKQFKVDLNTLTGSGPHGRIVAADIEAASGQTTTATTTAPAAAPQPSLPAPAPLPAAAAAGEVVPFNTLQQAVVNNMVASLAVPTFHVEYSIVTDALDQLYKQVKSKGVTMTALLAKAVAVTLRQHPLVNASCAPQGIQYSSSINIAVAVAMPGGGLITPVLQQADQMDLYSLSRTWKDLVARARSKQLQPDEYSTGTFTLSNLGMFGVNSFDAILPPGQGSILAIGGSKPQVVADAKGMMGVKRLMNVNITCDHRVIYGADAAAFLKDLAELIETNPQSLTL